MHHNTYNYLSSTIHRLCKGIKDKDVQELISYCDLILENSSEFTLDEVILAWVRTSEKEDIASLGVGVLPAFYANLLVVHSNSVKEAMRKVLTD